MAITRRAALHTALASAAALALAACANPEGRAPTTTEPSPMTTPTSGRTLLVCFSRTGENYWDGGRRDLDVGNTEALAVMIAARTGCDLHRIEAADPYPHGYDDTVARNVREQDADARPAIAGDLPDLAGYDTVILASPIWNVRPPMIMSTFAESVPLGGRTLLPVTTHAMSGLGRAVEVYAALAPEATIGEGLAVRGEQVAEAGPELDRWLSVVGLIPA
ncbi:flavodoxin [Cellulomonas cellasea]|uniref:flavodoxin n=1 Tax=Cellulomonas cellasea TaxID=43670 RepID=UPI0025A495B7|nr:flavodoxin [Cellulomonas cellasea]MDM8084481.1 flavodoxin [Cellulomonas cellasea]